MTDPIHDHLLTSIIEVFVVWISSVHVASWI